MPPLSGPLRGLDQVTGTPGFDGVKLLHVFVPPHARHIQLFAQYVHDMPRKVVEKLRTSGELAGWGDVLAHGVRDARHTYEQLSQRPVLDYMKESQRIVILGDPGAGKSSLLRMQLVEWATAAVPRYETTLHGSAAAPSSTAAPSVALSSAAAPASLTMQLPLIIELGALHKRSPDTLRDCDPFLFVAHLAACGGPINFPLNENALNAQLASGRAVVFFDALDEVLDRTARDSVSGAIASFSRLYPSVRLVVTSRIIGYDPTSFAAAGFTQLVLQDLDDSLIDAFIDKWHDETWPPGEPERKREKKDILRVALGQSPAIRQLARNPLLLTMLAILNRCLVELPRSPVRLYDECTRLLLARWNVHDAMWTNSLLRPYVDVFDIDLKSAILRRLAWEMQAGDDERLGKLMLQQPLESLIVAVITPRLGTGAPLGLIAKAIIAQLHEHNFILSFLGGNAYAFIHRSFLEYFCARAIEWMWINRTTDATSYMVVLADLYRKHACHSEWHEILVLVSGMIASEYVGPCLDSLLESKQLLLAARCVAALKSRFDAGPHVEAVRMSLVAVATGRQQVGFVGSASQPLRPESSFSVTESEAAVRALATAFASDPATLPLLRVRPGWRW